MVMNVYLGEKGITSTSANYLANLAKEVIKEAEAELNNISFVDLSIELINGNKKNLRMGMISPKNIEDLLTQVANMHSFCAWIREAIKAKEEALTMVNSLTMESFCKLEGIVYPETPEAPLTITETDIVNEMNIKERNNYLRLEAFASTFGKYIHPGGRVAVAREEMLYHLNVPNEVQGEGRDMIIYSYSPSTNKDVVNKAFIELQNQHRDFEKQLNAIKYSIKEEVNKRNSAAQNQYAAEYEKYSHEIQRIRQAMNSYLIQAREEVVNMKIVIPEKLQDTYKYLESLGKK